MPRVSVPTLVLVLATVPALGQPVPELHGECEVTMTVYPLRLTEAGPQPPAAPGRGTFDIVINPGAALAANGPALAAFNRAAAQWESVITDPITVSISANLANLGGGGVLGSTDVVSLAVSPYSALRTLWIADADVDDGILASLPASRSFSVPAGFAVSGETVASKASLKAIGGFGDLDGQFGANDATITFNTQFAFDFDNSNGVTSGFTDFETVAAHEIGHALGFTTTVDLVDALVFNGLTDTVEPTTLDHLRFLDNSGSDPGNTTGFSSFTRELRPNVTAITDYVIALGTEAVEYLMSTGRLTGDGRQASHWKDDSLAGARVGIMDPTLATIDVSPITDADLRALDLIGYDMVLAPDCNGNGTIDSADLAQGTSQDCNDNDVPDECDVLTPVPSSFSLSPNLAIPDGNIPGVSSVINVPLSGTIVDVDVALRFNHTWQGDLRVTLSHGGVTRTLIDGPGTCSEPNFGYSADNFGSAIGSLVLDDAAAGPIDCYAGGSSGGINNYRGPARPEQTLSAFNGLDMSGTWTLNVSDLATPDAGTLVSWRLDIDTPPVDCNANGTPDECEAGCGPAVTVTSAVSRKSNAGGPGGVCDLPLLPNGQSEPRQDGIGQVRIGFSGVPGGPGLEPVTIEQATCAAPAFVPYSGAAVLTPTVAGTTLILNFSPALENARTYRIHLGPVVTSIPGQFIEVRGLVGDVDNSGRTNATDRSAVVAAWTSVEHFSCATDLDSSSRTNATDRSILVASWTGMMNCAP